MRNANLVANELHNAGFRTRVITSTAVEISLNRKVTVLEAQYATDTIFDGIQFGYTYTNGKVIINW